MTEKKIAIVTGGNRGIGFEICRQLAKNQFYVILTSRDQEKGKYATEKLLTEKLSVHYHPLDVADLQSRISLKNYVDDKFGKIDVLVNNAGVYLDQSVQGLNVSLEVIQNTLEINLLGPLILCQLFIPLMKSQNYGRIINLSSGMGSLDEMGSGSAAYRISKTALNAMTKIFANEVRNYNILINSMCPGWVRTEMGGPGAVRSVKKGAETAVWLAMLPEGGPTGGFFRDNKKIPW